jgi:DNA-binding transcriptional ArsR family regulator
MTAAGEKIEQRLAKALTHPVRMRVLTLLNQKVASPSELAEELGEPLGNVSYHVRMLLDLDLVELVNTKPRRGAVEHYYRATASPGIWDQLPDPLREGIADAILTKAWEDTLAAVEAGTFDSRADSHLSHTALVLDEQGWGEVAELLNETRDRAMTIEAAAAKRVAQADGTPLDARLIFMHYEAAPGKGKRGR